MYVFKFGGGSIKSADEIKSAASIISNYKSIPLMVVVSAMGKTTNALERVVEYYFNDQKQSLINALSGIKQFHLDVAAELFDNQDTGIIDIVEEKFALLESLVKTPPCNDYNFEYDRIVPMGEDISSTIISYYLDKAGIPNKVFHAKDIIITNKRYRDARVCWDHTQKKVNEILAPYFHKTQAGNNLPIAITQGFVGGTVNGETTTLGREGSDYSAAILAYFLKAKEVYTWKDVPGLLNADPKIVKQTFLLPNISYLEAIELAYYGAKVIHPKTLKPLLIKNIPLRVKSFYKPWEEGTLINNNDSFDALQPSYIFKFNQVMINISSKDYSFIAEHNLSLIFQIFARLNISISIMQNSALRFIACFDFDKTKTPALINELKEKFNTGCSYGHELLTIRHYRNANPGKFIKGRKVLLEQKTKNTLQILIE